MSRLLIIIAILLPVTLRAQISAPGSNATRYTNYPVTDRDDPIYIFCTSGTVATGTLTAVSPGGTAPFTFTWTRYDSNTGGYTIPVYTSNGSSSTVSNLPEGGYSVRITDGTGYDTTLYAWVNLDSPYASASLRNFTCDYVALEGVATQDNFSYYDPSTGALRLLPNGIRHVWSSVPSSTIPYPDLELNPVTFSPPLTDVEYMLTVTDSFGCSSISSFNYTSIHVNADFSADPTTGEAPLQVTFTDNSVRGLYYTWKFGDDSLSTNTDPGPHTYYIPGEYTVVLTIESELTCTDSATVKITVEPSSLQIPNVFSPNEDGINDYFLPEKKSLKFINIQIFAKSGHRVYYYQGDGEDLQNWNGWDGRINYSDRKAEPGAYYYVIRAVGYDDIDYRGRDYRGTLYLFR